MDKVKRNERIAVMTRILVDAPNEVISFSAFCERFGAAKSSISEDVTIIDDALQQNGLGSLQTIAGAAGGVRYRPCGAQAKDYAFMQSIAQTLCAPERVLPGGYLYLSDILSDPVLMRRMGEIIACAWYEQKPDFVLTMETKGIPVAMMTARALNPKRRRGPPAFQPAAESMGSHATCASRTTRSCAQVGNAADPAKWRLLG